MSKQNEQTDEIKLKVSDQVEDAGTTAASPHTVASAPVPATPSTSINELQTYVRRRLQAQHERAVPLVNMNETTLRVAADLIEASELSSLTIAVSVGYLVAFAVGCSALTTLVWMAQQRAFTDGDERRLRDLLLVLVPFAAMLFPLLGLVGHSLAQRNTTIGRLLLGIAFAPAWLFNSPMLGAPLAGRCLTNLQIQTGNFKAARKVLRKLESIRSSPESILVRTAAEAHVASALAEMPTAEQKRAEARKLWDELSCDIIFRSQIGRAVFNNIGASYEAAGLYEDAYKSYLQALEIQMGDANSSGDTTQLATSVLGIAAAAARMGRTGESNDWLATFGDYQKHAPPWMVPHFARVRIFAAIASGDLKQAYTVAHAALDAGVDNIVGEIHLLGGELALELCEKERARIWLREAFARQSKTLPMGHPVFARTAAATKTAFADSPRESDVVRLLLRLQTACSTASGGVTPEQPQVSVDDKQSRRGQKIVAIFGFFIAGSFARIVLEGFRAADITTWAALISLIGLLIGTQVYLRKLRLTAASLRQRYERHQRTEAEVGIAEGIRIGEGSLTAQIGPPFNTKLVIANAAVAELPLGRKLACEVIADENGQPVAFEYAGKLVALCQIQSSSKAMNRLIGGIAGGAIVVMSALFALISYSSEAHEHVPNGLTAYEYYRWGADRMDAHWKYTPSFYNLSLVRDAWTRAAKEDPTGVWGKLASQALQAELPKDPALSDEQVNEFGTAVTDNQTHEQSAILLQQCIKKTPNFEWPYAALAELRVKQGRLDDADKLLHSAGTINPKSMQYLLARAHYQSARGDRKASIATLNEARELDPFLRKPYEELLSTLIHP